MSWHKDRIHGKNDRVVTAAAYAVPPYKETLNYVKAVTGIYEQLQSANPLAGRVASASARGGKSGGAGSRIRMTLPGSPSEGEANP